MRAPLHENESDLQRAYNIANKPYLNYIFH